MKSKKRKKRRPKLNEGLCPEQFRICVPKQCKLLGDWDSHTEWRRYLKKLTQSHRIPHGYEDPPECCTCDCKPAWELRGELAIAHACKVHDHINRQILGLDQVSAVDVGFAILEQQTEFENFLSIRVHVNKKRSPEQLVRAGLASLTEPLHAFFDASGNFLLPPLDAPSPLSPDAPPCDPPLPPEACDCKHCHCECGDCKKKCKSLQKILNKELKWWKPDEQHHWWKEIRQSFVRYPIGGVSRDDLSIFCPYPAEDTCTLADIRLCICGVPLDIINAEYNPSVHPGGDADRGVFVEPPGQSVRLSDEELRLIGRGRVTPLVGGVSVGTVTGQAGTLGAVVWDETDGTACVLSNWHVLAGTSTAQIGQPTYQPAIFDGGTEDDVVAHLKRWRLDEEGDAAISELNRSRHYASGEILGLWHPISGYLEPKLNMKIRKWGRTTGFTQGFIDGIHLATNIDYGNDVVRYFKNQFHIAPLFPGDDVSQNGDSGSLVVTSLRPLDQREDLEKLSDWLRRCCKNQGKDLREEIKNIDPEKEADACCCKGQKGEDICKGLPKKNQKKLLKKCKKNCKDPYETFKAILEKLKDSVDRDDEPGLKKLCDDLDKRRNELKEMCEPTVACAKFCRHLEEILERWAKDCNANHGCGIRSTVKENISQMIRQCKKLECKQKDEICEILTDLENDCKDKKKSGADLCNKIQQHLDTVKGHCKALKSCADFCRCADQRLKDWYDRCVTERLCEILESACSESLCKDPSVLIRCIEKKLEEEPSLEDKVTQMLSLEAKPGQKPEKNVNEELEKIKKLLRLLVQEELDLDPDEVIDGLEDGTKNFRRHAEKRRDREATRVYFAVGMIFAGDTPGSPFGEFAVASNISRLAKKLRFSLRPVFEPRSGFRELRERPPQERFPASRSLRSRGSLSPGDQVADSRGGGPQPQLESSQTGSGNSG